MIGAAPHERSETRTAQRNGHRPKPDGRHIRSQLDEVARMLEDKFPDVAEMLHDATEDLLAFT